jgi:hypothetical protein
VRRSDALRWLRSMPLFDPTVSNRGVDWRDEPSIVTSIGFSASIASRTPRSYVEIVHG